MRISSIAPRLWNKSIKETFGQTCIFYYAPGWSTDALQKRQQAFGRQPIDSWFWVRSASIDYAITLLRKRWYLQNPKRLDCTIKSKKQSLTTASLLMKFFASSSLSPSASIDILLLVCFMSSVRRNMCVNLESVKFHTPNLPRFYRFFHIQTWQCVTVVVYVGGPFSFPYPRQQGKS